MQKHLLQYRGVIVHGRVLGQKAHLHVGVPGNGTGVSLRDPGQDLQKGGFAGAVDADDTGLVPLIQIEIHILQQLAAAKIDGEVLRG